MARRFSSVIPLAPWPETDPRREGQQTLLRVERDWVRIHRFGAPPPGASRANPDRLGDGRVTFVLIHGVGLSSQYLVPLAAELAFHGEVFLLDLPGFGDLPRPDRALSVAGFGAIVDAALKFHGVLDPILVGHSMGAQVVVEMMAHSDKYRRGVLIGPPVNAFERTPLMQAWRYIQSAIYEKPNLALLALRSYARTLTGWVLDIMPLLMSYPIEDRIELIPRESQVLILHGEFDRLAPDDWVAELCRRGPDTQDRTIAGAAHSTVYNDDDDVAAHILSLLRTDERESDQIAAREAAEALAEAEK